MRYGLSTYTYPWAIREGRLGIDELLTRTADAGLTALQLCENLPGYDSLTEDQWRRAQDLGITLEFGTRGIDADRLRYLADLSRRTGAEFVRLVMDAEGDEPSVSEAIDRLGPLQAELGEFRLAIENHDRFPADSLVEIVRATGTAIVLDTANSIGSLEGMDTLIPRLAPFTVCLHLKDVRTQRFPYGQGIAVLGTAAGDGQLDLRTIHDAVLATGPVQSVILEHWFRAPEDESEMALARSLRTFLGLRAPVGA